MIEGRSLCHRIQVWIQVENAPWAEENTNEEIRWWHDFIILVEFYLLTFRSIQRRILSKIFSLVILNIDFDLTD